MLTNILHLPQETDYDKAVILGYSLKNIIAIDLETQAELHVSHARRKHGRPSRYFVIAPNGGLHIHYFKTAVTPDNPRGKSVNKDYSRVFTLTAFDDDEAIEKANKMLPAKYSKFLSECYREQVQEEGVDFSVGHAWWQE